MQEFRQYAHYMQPRIHRMIAEVVSAPINMGLDACAQHGCHVVGETPSTYACAPLCHELDSLPCKCTMLKPNRASQCFANRSDAQQECFKMWYWVHDQHLTGGFAVADRILWPGQAAARGWPGGRQPGHQFLLRRIRHMGLLHDLPSGK